MWGFPVRHHDLAHDEGPVGLGSVREDRHRFQHAVRAMPFCLPGGTSVKSPHGQFFQFGKVVKLLDLSLAAQIRDGFIPVEPNVFEFIFRHEQLNQ